MGEVDSIINIFPNLANDPHFKITSPIDKNYNCLAWAFSLYKDRWMQHDTTPRLDGVYYWWPNGVNKSPEIKDYIDAFKSHGFVECESSELEMNFIKIALYFDPDSNICLHAARQKRNGIWMSKLGPSWDIEHSSPYVIEGSNYGKVFCIMKMSVN